jgi:hypothetical protein
VLSFLPTWGGAMSHPPAVVLAAHQTQAHRREYRSVGVRAFIVCACHDITKDNTGIQRYETMEPTSPVLGFRPPGRTPTVEFAASTARPSGATNPHHGDVGQSRRRRPSLSLNSDVPRAPTRNSTFPDRMPKIIRAHNLQVALDDRCRYHT